MDRHPTLLLAALLFALTSVGCDRECEAASDCNDGDDCTFDECAGKGLPNTDGAGCRHTPLTDGDGDGHDSIACGGLDCDDSTGARYPGNPEICDSADVDEDCNALTFGDRDADNDGSLDARCCNRGAGGEAECGTDCDDNRAGVHPSATESCNAFDDDCDGATDEGVGSTYYPDADQDGYGNPAGAAQTLCVFEASGFSALANDCDDTNAAITPGAMVCTGGQTPNGVRICGSTGAYANATCGAGTLCRVQPNGTGICEQ